MSAPSLAGAAPPRRVWLTAGSLAAATLLALVTLPVADLIRRADLGLARLDATPPRAVHVVAIGSSKTLRAFEFDDTFARRLSSPARPVVFHRITWRGATMLDLHPAVDALLQAPPAVVVVESDLLLVEKHALADPTRIQTPWSGLLAPLRAPSRHNRSDNRGGPQSWCNSGSSFMPTVYAAAIARWEVLPPEARTLFLAPLRSLQQAGSRVVLLDLPRSQQAAGVFPAELLQQMERARDALLHGGNLTWWSPKPLPSLAYCDGGHVNDTGRRLLSAWLAARLRRLLAHAHV